MLIVLRIEVLGVSLGAIIWISVWIWYSAIFNFVPLLPTTAIWYLKCEKHSQTFNGSEDTMVACKDGQWMYDQDDRTKRCSTYFTIQLIYHKVSIIPVDHRPTRKCLLCIHIGYLIDSFFFWYIDSFIYINPCRF